MVAGCMELLKGVVNLKRLRNTVVDHIVRNCLRSTKCRTCGPRSQNEHATALHECFISRNTGAADTGSDQPGSKNETIQNERNERVGLKANSSEECVILLRTSAVKIVNPTSGKSSLVYVQHDTGSQVTLISDNLKTELGLETVPEPSVTIRILADKTVPVEGRTNFKLQSLYNGEEFDIKDALVVAQFLYDAHTLPHAVDTSKLEQFDGVHIPVVPDRRRVDVLIGQSDKSLLTVLEEREGMDAEEPNYVLARLGPIASGGRVCGHFGSSNCLYAMRINVGWVVNANCECAKLREENVALKQSIRQYELQDEMVQPSRNDELAHELIESDIQVKDARYEIPVPFKLKKLQTLPYNYENALRRVHTEAVNVYVTVSSPFSVLPLFGGDGNLNVRGSH